MSPIICYFPLALVMFYVPLALVIFVAGLVQAEPTDVATDTDSSFSTDNITSGRKFIETQLIAPELVFHGRTPPSIAELVLHPQESTGRSVEPSHETFPRRPVKDESNPTSWEQRGSQNQHGRESKILSQISLDARRGEPLLKRQRQQQKQGVEKEEGINVSTPQNESRGLSPVQGQPQRQAGEEDKTTQLLRVLRRISARLRKLCRRSEQMVGWLRHPFDCSRYFTCSGGQVRELSHCGQGLVFSIRLQRCVAADSDLDDCHRPWHSAPSSAGHVVGHPEPSILPLSSLSRPTASEPYLSSPLNIFSSPSPAVSLHGSPSPVKLFSFRSLPSAVYDSSSSVASMYYSIGEASEVPVIPSSALPITTILAQHVLPAASATDLGSREAVATPMTNSPFSFVSALAPGAAVGSSGQDRVWTGHAVPATWPPGPGFQYSGAEVLGSRLPGTLLRPAIVPEEMRGHGEGIPPFAFPLSPSSSLSSASGEVEAEEVDEVEEALCGRGPRMKRGLQPHPGNCAWYYNCSLSPDGVTATFLTGHVLECPYPQLFSARTLQCEDFEDVQCLGRYEPKSPCDYRANHCNEASHCIPCWVRYASCLGREDGLNPWPELEWKPFFVECYRQRTVFQGTCDKSSVFSPLTRACETPYSIPREHGGWRPGCAGRRDGKHADELGRCAAFYTCQTGLFTGYHSCPGPTVFDPPSGLCRPASQVAYPCGDQELPSSRLCQGKGDGRYLDPYGRCTHYYTCAAGKAEGFSMCPEGVFNPVTRACEATADDAPSPCGPRPNPCLDQPDGYYRSGPFTSSLDRDGAGGEGGRVGSELYSFCRSYYLCQSGLMAALLACSANQVFDDGAGSCVDVAEAAPPCGLAPSCRERGDGRYPALARGLSHFFVCRRSRFAGYGRCSGPDGDLAFSPKRRRCDSPANVCAEVTGSTAFCLHRAVVGQ